jgi:hypothetical protein
LLELSCSIFRLSHGGSGFRGRPRQAARQAARDDAGDPHMSKVSIIDRVIIAVLDALTSWDAMQLV